jgi:gluconokinase
MVLMGVSGSGKTTIGHLLSARTGWQFLDADDLHPASNVVKMQAGIPLTDDDRWPWLRQVAIWIRGQAQAGHAGIVGCSALKRSYRDLLRGADPSLRFVYLRGDGDLLMGRQNRRLGHFCPRDLLDTQLETLEEPGPEEHPIIVPIGQSSDRQVEAILAGLTGQDNEHRSAEVQPEGDSAH